MREKDDICIERLENFLLYVYFLVRVLQNLRVCVRVCVCVFTSCVTLHDRIANLLVMGSYCRGGIVHIRFGFPRALLVPPYSPTALWRFRVSTSNSLSGLSGLHTHTLLRQIYHTYAQQDIRVRGDDHFEPPIRRFRNSKALSLLRVSI